MDEKSMCPRCCDQNARLRKALTEVLDVAELFVPVPLDAPGFRRAREALLAALGPSTANIDDERA